MTRKPAAKPSPRPHATGTIFPNVLPKTTYEVVTAVKARDWLKHNIDNRPLRRSKVEELKRMFTAGEYVLTHQGIAFCIDGTLNDGQHRLTAIAEMPDSFSVVMAVTRGQAKEAFKVTDLHTKRSNADALRISPSLAECARYLAALVDGTASKSPQALRPYVDFVEPHFETLLEGNTAKRRTWSSASVRAAAVISMAMGSPAAYVCEIYRTLLTADFNAMPPVAQALFRAELNGRVKAQEKYDMFVRAMKVFNPAFANQSKVQIKDTTYAVAEVREFMTATLGDI